MGSVRITLPDAPVAAVDEQTRSPDCGRSPDRFRRPLAGYGEWRSPAGRRYRASAAALLVRLKQIEVIDESTLAYAFQTFARGWRASEPEPLEGPGEEGRHELPRRFERFCYRALAEGLISLAKAGELLRQPLEKIEHGLRGPA
jgi:hypothetical protein